MTRAPKDPKRPLRRLVVASGKTVVLEITEQTLSLRYPRHRQPHVTLTYGQLETRALLARPVTRRRARRQSLDLHFGVVPKEES